jgi:hypothetical protein
MQLCLRPGSVLEINAAQRRGANICLRAHEFLTVPCTLAPDVRLADALGLLDASSPLVSLFQHLGLVPVLAAIRTSWVAGSSTVPAGEVAAVQLYRVWHHNSRSSTWRGTSELHMRGVSLPLATDLLLDHVTYRTGERVHWSLRSAPIAPLLHLPLYLEPQVEVLEDDRASASLGQRLPPVSCDELTLEQVLNALLNELCDQSFAT